MRCATFKEVFSAEHLCEDAADGPDVDGAAVLEGQQHELGGAVPARRHVLRHVVVVVVLLRRHAPRHACRRSTTQESEARHDYAKYSGKS